MRKGCFQGEEGPNGDVLFEMNSSDMNLRTSGDSPGPLISVQLNPNPNWLWTVSFGQHPALIETTPGVKNLSEMHVIRSDTKKLQKEGSIL